MAKFALIVRPDGRAMLTTPGRLSDQEALVLREAVKAWEAGHLLVVADCEVVQVRSLDIDLTPLERTATVATPPLAAPTAGRV